MSATATRPPDQRHNPMVEEEGIVWLCHSGFWLGIPEDATGETLQRAMAALEWMANPEST